MYTTTVTITNKTGLHARPAQLFTQRAAKFQSKITIENGGKVADAKSILRVLSLGIRQGTAVVLTVDGADEEEAAAELVALLESFED